MKSRTFFTALAIVFCGLNVSAQGNLQFNQVKYFQLLLTQLSSSAFDQTTQVVTVPANKVWKIEAASATYYSPTSGSAVFGGKICIDGHVLFDYANTPGGFNTLPFWLPAGTYTLALKSNTTSSTYYFNGAVSVIEFNVVP